MEAREFKLDINPNDPAQLSQEEQRLKAIKKILVGNQIERLENRFRGLSRRVESTNGHLVAVVEDLNNEFGRLKNEFKLRDSSSLALDENTQKKLEQLLSEQKDLKFEDSAICKQLENRIDTIEESLKSGNSLDAESQEQMDAMSEDIRNFKEKLRHTQERLSKLDNAAKPEDKAKVDQRLSSLEAKIKSLNPKKMEARINRRQEDFEDSVQDLVERLAGRVNERFDFASKGRKKLAENQSEIVNEQKQIKERHRDLEQHQEVLFEKTVALVQGQEQLKNQMGSEQEKLKGQQSALKNRVDSIQEVLENDIMSFLQNVKVDKERHRNLEQHQEVLFEKTGALVQEQEQLKNQMGSEQEKLKGQQSALKNRVDSIQEVLENDIMNFLQNVKVDKDGIQTQVKNFAGDLERKIYENNVRMEAKIDAFIDLSQRQLQKPQAPQEDPKMKAIKETLKKLSSLLDE